MGSKITEINKETFWQLIEETKNQCGQDMDASISWIKKRTVKYAAGTIPAISYDYVRIPGCSR